MGSQVPIPEFISDQNQSIVKSWCYTQTKVTKFSFIWTIDRFSCAPENVGEPLDSSKFPAESTDKLKWYLRLYPKGADEENKDFVSIFLRLFSCDKTEVRAQFKFSIINARKEETKALETEYKFSKNTGFGWNRLVHRDFLLDKANGLLPDDKLTLYCEVSMADYINISGQKCDVQFNVPQCPLSDDLGQLFESERYSDVTLSANGRNFAAHKAILAARSKVFSAMFEHEMEEKKQNKADIIDVHHKVLSEMLSYIYTGKVSNVENMTVDLLIAADKYALDHLKIMCEEHICSKLSVSNAAEVLIVADMHSAKKLKAHVIDFISMHATDVMAAPGWRTMVQVNSHFVNEVSEVLAAWQIPRFEPPQKRRKL